MNLALLVIDVQRGLFEPQPPPAEADAVVGRINVLSAKAREAGMPVVFLICEKCGAVGEAASAAVEQSLSAAARQAGFTPKSPVVEISGICTHCR